MVTGSVDDAQLKRALKEAIVELIEERRDLVLALFEEALEDVALTRAIQEGEQTELVDGESVRAILKGQK